jgi:curved DNA-binding protein
MKFKDYYQILGVAATATDAELKSAYRKKARKYHPDVSKEKGAEDRFKDVNEAYDALREPEKRKTYDRIHCSGIKPGDEYNPQGHAQGHGGGGFGFDFDQGQGEDLFESMFGRRRQQPPADERVKLRIDLEKAYSGGPQRIVLTRAGTERALEVKIPAGVTSGQVIRLAGQGQSQRGKSDLLIEIDVLPHPVFRLEGKDTYSTLRLMPWEAALGCKRAVATLAGDVDMMIPADSNTGRKMRFKGRGFGKTGEAGDHYLTIELANPAELSPALRAAYMEIAAATAAANTEA